MPPAGYNEVLLSTQPDSNQWHYMEDGIVIGAALKIPDQAETMIPVMNLTDELCTPYRGRSVRLMLSPYVTE